MLRPLLVLLLGALVAGHATAQTEASADAGKLRAVTEQLLSEVHLQGSTNSRDLASIAAILERIDEAIRAQKPSPLYIFYNPTNLSGSGVVSDAQEFICRAFPGGKSGRDCEETARQICTRYGYSKADILRTGGAVAFSPTTEYPPILISFVCYG